ncbi:hypothetical protein B0J13DRAFT_586549 [Dactylonectria estremocensis]|uniref:Uncharacterized protein n=1 Tax=Dactylonectria estremocensis TaxID=1079267 RepID=A0A9P9J1P8_9HYPO|nr:hypothetical protein B0J13DRAFT_586549 [Dactylonectria estremocensis]
MAEQHQKFSSQAYGWLSGCLRWPSLLTFCIFDIALFTTILSLTIVSSENDGFVTISSSNTTTSESSNQTGSESDGIGSFWDLGILWTSLPSFVLSLFGAYWAWMAGSIAERQPYVELRNEDGAEARKSILLDYRVTASIWRWWGAFRNSHYTVGATTLLSVLLTYAVAPFAARLFVAEVVMKSDTVPVIFNEAYNVDGINATLDWRPVLDTVAATLLYQGTQIPWTDDEHAFLPFTTSSDLVSGSIIASHSTAYSAYVSCELVDDYTITSTDGTEDSTSTVEISGNDRGCSFKQSFGVSSTQDIYFKTTVEFGCSARAYYSRLVFTAATYSSTSPHKLDKLSVISCATGYRQVEGTLKVSVSSSGPPIIQSFEETGQRDTERPKLWRVFEQDIFGPVSINPHTTWSTTDMGNLILYHAQRSQPSNFLASDVLAKAISIVFTTIYLNAVALHGFETLTKSKEATGTAFSPVTRLFVVPWVSYIVLGFLMITLCSVVFLFFWLRKCPSILTEEPQGLLSMAAIVNKSELLWIVSDIRQDPEFVSEIRKTSKSRPDVKHRKWTSARDPNSGSWMVRLVENVEIEAAERFLS